MRSVSVLIIVVMSNFLIAPLSYSDSGHTGGKQQPMMKMASTDVFAGGIQVTFMVMMNRNHESMLENMKMNEKIESGTTHNIMIVVRDEETGREIKNLPIIIKVTDPNDNEQTKTGSFKEMMKSYDAYFAMREKGTYVIKILFETDGQKRSVGLSYDLT